MVSLGSPVPRGLKVLLASTDNPYIMKYGGKHIHLEILERGLRGLGLEVYTNYYNSRAPAEILKKGLASRLPEGERYLSLVARRVDYLRERATQGRYDVLHAHDVVSMCALKGCPGKRVMTIHGYFAKEALEYFSDRSEGEKVFDSLFEYEREGVQEAEFIIAVDTRLRDYLIKEHDYPSYKMEVLFNAIDTDIFSPVAGAMLSTLRARHAIPDSYGVLLVPRRLVEKNGVVYAVRAMRLLEGQKIIMLIAGDGPESDNIVKEICDDRIRMLGAVPHDQIASYYQLSDLVLVPSITSHGVQEATSLSMLEAMSCGKVVICSNIGGLKEVIRNDENGLVVGEGDPSAIAEAVNRAYKHPELFGILGSRAREYVVMHHSYQSHSKRVMEIYNRLLGRT